jgi:hypothetical protein
MCGHQCVKQSPVVTICTTHFNLQKPCHFAQTVYLCVLYNSHTKH